MGVPVRTSILAAIKTVIEGVSVANGFKTEVDTTEPVLKSRDEIPDGKRPYLGFGPDRSTYEHYMDDTIRAQMPITIVGYIDEYAWSDASVAINKIRDDIIAAIMADHTLGGNATQTLLREDLTDEADPDRADTPDDGGAVELHFMVTYYRTTGSS